MANSWQSPVSGEPSLGTPHTTADAQRSSTLLVNTSTNTAGTWSAAVTMTGAPTGAKAAYCICHIEKAAAVAALSVEAATGYTLSDTTVGTNRFKYCGLRAASSGGAAEAVVKIHLDSSKQFKWCTDNTNSTVQIGPAIDYDS